MRRRLPRMLLNAATAGCLLLCVVTVGLAMASSSKPLGVAMSHRNCTFHLSVWAGRVW